MVSFVEQFCGLKPLVQVALLTIFFNSVGVAAQSEPAQFTANPSVGPGGSKFYDSPRFRIWDSEDSLAKDAAGELEAAYDCFVNTLGWRSSGLSFHLDRANTYYKTNIYGVQKLDGAAGVMGADVNAGYSYLTVMHQYLTEPAVTVHEYGHALTYHERTWVDQGRTGAWWETVAEFVADTYLTSPLCKAARDKNSQPEGRTIVDLNKVIGDSHQVIVDGSVNTGNYYQAWPFLSYLTYNPDKYEGLGTALVRELFRQYKTGSNETPLHALDRVATKNTAQELVGRYWARMAYADIGHTQVKDLFQNVRSSINYRNLDSAGSGSYKVKSARQPKYMGANINPLKASSTSISATITASGPYTAHLAIRASNGNVRYIAFSNNAASATLASGEEATLVVANTPATLYNYDGFSITGDVAKGLDYTVKLTGATPSSI